jgi:hypothetical protein
MHGIISRTKENQVLHLQNVLNMSWKVFDHSPLNAQRPRELVSLTVLGFQEKITQVVYSPQMAKCEKARILKVILVLAKGAEIARAQFPFWQHHFLANLAVPDEHHASNVFHHSTFLFLGFHKT